MVPDPGNITSFQNAAVNPTRRLSSAPVQLNLALLCNWLGWSCSIARRTFSMRDYGRPGPEFADRFGPAYKSEVAVFVECCRNGQPFPTSHRDGVSAQEIITAGMQAILTSAQAAPVPRASAMNV